MPAFTVDYCSSAIKVIQNVLDDVKPELMENYGQIGHDVKHDNTVVTRLDHEIEEKLKIALSKFDDTIPFVGEEGGLNLDSDTFWLVDPIDGTEHFVRGLPFCSNMVTLVVNYKPVLAIINMFTTDQLYTAIENKGAFCNGQRLRVSDVPMSRAILEFETNTVIPECLEKWIEVRKEIYGYVNFLSSGSGYSTTANGKIEGRIVMNGWGYPWDYAPGALMVSEAGGKVANIGSDNYDIRNLNLIAATPVVFDRLQEIVSK